MLEVKDLSAGYGAMEIVHQISFSLSKSQRMAMVGPNGAGKTTLLEAIAGFVTSRSGDVRFNGTSLGQMKPEERARHGIALVTERRNLFPDLTAGENIRLGRCAVPGEARWDKTRVGIATERVYELFPKLKLIRDRPVRVMSGGEQQMVAVGRALVSEPSVLMLDEPSQGLAPKLVETMYEAIVKIAMDTTILIVEQDLDLARSVSDNVHLMRDGRLHLLSEEEMDDEEQFMKLLFGR